MRIPPAQMTFLRRRVLAAWVLVRERLLNYALGSDDGKTEGDQRP